MPGFEFRLDLGQAFAQGLTVYRPWVRVCFHASQALIDPADALVESL